MRPHGFSFVFFSNKRIVISPVPKPDLTLYKTISIYLGVHVDLDIVPQFL